MRRLLYSTAILVTLLAIASVGTWSAASAVTVVDVALDRPGAPIAPTMYGVFYEDINFAGDGGLSPERVKNRSFEFPDPLMGWKTAVPEGGRFEIRSGDGVRARTQHSLRIEATGPQPCGVMNWDMTSYVI
jgi:alpha-L-arabinofuranosidase